MNTTAYALAAALMLSAAEQNLIKSTMFIAKGSKTSDGTLELKLGRERKDYKPMIMDGGIIASVNLPRGKYRISFQYKGEQVKNVTVYIDLNIKIKKRYPSKNIQAADGKDWAPMAFEFDVPENAEKVKLVIMFKTPYENKNAVAFMKDLKLTAVEK